MAILVDKYSDKKKKIIFIFTLLVIFVGQILIVTFGGEMFNVVSLQIGDWMRIVLCSSVILWVGEVERLAKRMLKRK